MEGNLRPDQNRIQPTKKVQKLQVKVTPIIDTTWTTIKDTKHNIHAAQKEFKNIIPHASKLHKPHLLQRASSHDI